MTLPLFRISPQFCEETRCLITVLCKSHKKKVLPSAVPIIEEEEELYIKIYYPDQNTIDTNHAFLQTPKQELAYRRSILYESHYLEIRKEDLICSAQFTY